MASKSAITLKKQMWSQSRHALIKGLKDGLSGAKAIFEEEQVKETMAAFQKEMMDKQAAASKEAGEKNATEPVKNSSRKTKRRTG